ncbi:MAG TPA: AIR synthase related protein, partial [Vicinamibacteria bacterium]|nr:AIR synthase related protein [Vicinamibacteria bacterium]
MTRSIDSMLTCPAPLDHRDIVELAHGGGGRKTARLVETLFAPAFRNPYLEPLGDGAIVTVGSERLAFTTDTFVVKPVFFPGGDIGSLAVHGTVNDLAMCGAEPLFLSAGYLLEEGFPMRDLERVVASMAAALSAVGVPLVTGDTKVVDRGKGDGIYVNTSGIGRVRDGVSVGPDRAAPGDAVIVSGPIGDHGIAVMAAREGID